MSRRGRGPLPPVLFLVALLVQAALHVVLPVFRVIPPAWGFAGIAVILIGLGVMVAADRQFKSADTAVSPHKRPSALVTDGVFRWSRNPMYLGMILTLFGGAVAWGTLTPFLVPPALAWILSQRFIQSEESVLSDTFGPDYERYQGRVRRWL